MNSRTCTRIIALTLLTALANPVSLAAQHNPNHHHKYHHYQLKDIGTFGGPNSSFIGPPPELRLLNNRGVAVGGADTSTPDPASCWNFDCYLSYGFKWRDGVVHKLDALPGFNSSFTYGVNDSGQVAGGSENGIDPLTGSLALKRFSGGRTVPSPTWERWGDTKAPRTLSIAGAKWPEKL